MGVSTTGRQAESWRADFLRYWTGDVISSVGDRFTMIALPLAVFASRHDLLAVAIVGAMPFISVAVLGNLCGVWADRWPLRPVLIGTELARAALLTAMAVALAAGVAPLWLLAVIALAMGVVRSLHECAEAVAVALVVPPEGLVWANSRFANSDMVANLVGPVGAGLLIFLAGAPAALGTDAATFAISALAASLVVELRRRHAAIDGDPGPPHHLTRELTTGFKRIWADRDARLVLCVGVGMNVTAIATDVQFVPYARQVLHLSPATLGLFFTWAAIVGLITVRYVGRATRVRGDTIIVGGGLFAGGILLAGLWPSIVTAAIAFAGAGIGSGMAFSHSGAFRQHRFQSAELGRVTAAHRTALTAAMPLAILASGVVGHHFGPAALFIAVGGAGLLAVGAATAAGLGRLRVG